MQYRQFILYHFKACYTTTFQISCYFYLDLKGKSRHGINISIYIKTWFTHTDIILFTLQIQPDVKIYYSKNKTISCLLPSFHLTSSLAMKSCGQEAGLRPILQGHLVLPSELDPYLLFSS